MAAQHDTKSLSLYGTVGANFFAAVVAPNTPFVYTMDTKGLPNGLTFYGHVYLYGGAVGAPPVTAQITLIEESDVDQVNGPYVPVNANYLNGTYAGSLNSTPTEGEFTGMVALNSIGVFSCKRYLRITVTCVSGNAAGLFIGLDCVAGPPSFPVDTGRENATA